MRGKELLISFFLMVGIIGMILGFWGLWISPKTLRVGFYDTSCPTAETIVRMVVERQVQFNVRAAAILLRLQFHDCFVQGCDASILLNNDDDETFASGNAGVMGFSIIEDAKVEIERVCPGVVSCSDIIALAARDAVIMANGPVYPVPTGRRDGFVSRSTDAANLPEPHDNLKALKDKFRKFGLSDRDLVLLSAGAHSIGETACFFVTPRFDFGDPMLDQNFSKVLRSSCPEGGNTSAKIPLDWDGDLVFDNHILSNIRYGKAVLGSDAVLYRDKSTRQFVDFYSTSQADFAKDFSRAMIKLGEINVKTKLDGEIRRFCNSTNKY